MKIVILFESYFGNTEIIAREMGNVSVKNSTVEVKNVKGVTWNDVSDADILFVGSATRGFLPCEHTKSFLKSIPRKGLKGKSVAAYDTRMALSAIDSRILHFIVNAGGYAAKRIASSLKKKGGKLIASPEGFLVTGEKGPLAEGEEERAAEWAQSVLSKNK